MSRREGEIQPNPIPSTRETLSLLELNNRIRDALSEALPDTYWVRAEMSDVRVNASSGHCYLEFVEKNPQSGQLVAKVRGSIWARIFRMLKPYFEMETGQAFASGLNVLVKVSVEFHELYGLSLNVLDIDPTYTIGDMARKRMEIIRQLQEEGVFTLNKELLIKDVEKLLIAGRFFIYFEGDGWLDEMENELFMDRHMAYLFDCWYADIMV